MLLSEIPRALLVVARLLFVFDDADDDLFDRSKGLLLWLKHALCTLAAVSDLYGLSLVSSVKVDLRSLSPKQWVPYFHYPKKVSFYCAAFFGASLHQ